MSDARTREALRRARAEGGTASLLAAQAWGLRMGALVRCDWCEAVRVPEGLCCHRACLVAVVEGREVAPFATAAIDLITGALHQSLERGRAKGHPRSSIRAMADEAEEEHGAVIDLLDVSRRHPYGNWISRACAMGLCGSRALRAWPAVFAAALKCCEAAEAPPSRVRCGWVSLDRNLSCDLDEGHDGDCVLA